MLFLTFSPLVSWAFSAATVFHHTVGCMRGVEICFLSMCVFHKVLVAVLKLIAISKECKYLYQLISGEVQSVKHLLISLNDRKRSYQLRSVQAYWHNLYLYVRRRASLCAGDAAFSLPSFAMFSIMWIIFNFCQRPLLEFAIPRRLRFSFLMSCRAPKFRHNSDKGFQMML